MDHVFRSKLIEALKSRKWTHLDADRAAERIADLYQWADEEWKVWSSNVASGSAIHWVARRENEVSIYESPFKGRTQDVASALNELERTRRPGCAVSGVGSAF